MRLRVMDLGAAKAGAFARSRQLLVLDRCGEELGPEEMASLMKEKPLMGVEMLVFAGDVQIGEDWEQGCPLHVVIPIDVGEPLTTDSQGGVWGTGPVYPSPPPQADLDALRERLSEPVYGVDSDEDNPADLEEPYDPDNDI